MFSGYDNRWSMNAVNRVNAAKNGVKDTMIRIVNDEINLWRHFNGNLRLRKELAYDGKLGIGLDYLYYHDSNPVNYLNTFFDGSSAFLFEQRTRSVKTTPVSVTVFNIDYVKKTWKNLVLETGFKLAVSSLPTTLLLKPSIRKCPSAIRNYPLNTH